MPIHQASEQMLEYLYQVCCALALLLNNDNADCQILNTHKYYERRQFAEYGVDK